MKPWRAALTSATASGKSTRIASRRAIACASGAPSTAIRFSAAAVRSTAVFSVSVANCSRCASCTGLGLLLGELAEAAEEILGIAAERKTEAAPFHAPRVTVPGVTAAELLGAPRRRMPLITSRHFRCRPRERHAPDVDPGPERHDARRGRAACRDAAADRCRSRPRARRARARAGRPRPPRARRRRPSPKAPNTVIVITSPSSVAWRRSRSMLPNARGT